MSTRRTSGSSCAISRREWKRRRSSTALSANCRQVDRMAMPADDLIPRRTAELDTIGARQHARLQELDERSERLAGEQRELAQRRQELDDDSARGEQALTGREHDAEELGKRARVLDDRGVELDELERVLDE